MVLNAGNKMDELDIILELNDEDQFELVQFRTPRGGLAPIPG